MKKGVLLLCLTVLFACSSNEQDKQAENPDKKEVKEVVKKAKIPDTIRIYRFGNFPVKKAQKLAKLLKTYFPKVELQDQALTLPAKHYNKQRNRYWATGLNQELSKHRNGAAVIGLTNYVIYKENEISDTFGIMGLSPVGKYMCVISSIIPRNGKEQSDENFIKLAVHELGHAFGLRHCPDQHCYMVDAEHKMKLPQTTGFCQSCKTKLNAKGWTIISN